MSVWLIGAGPHACAYAKVLNHLGTDYEAIGRSAASACQFNLVTGKTIRTTGVSGALLHSGPPETAIVAVSFDQLACVAISLISAGTKRILLEKPGALGVQEMAEVAAAAKKHKAAVWIAYNRRYYASTRYALEMIKDDGGPVSCNFEFTEWPHIISPWVVPAKVKDSLVIANSSHVIDLAFYICGLPDENIHNNKGRLNEKER